MVSTIVTLDLSKIGTLYACFFSLPIANGRNGSLHGTRCNRMNGGLARFFMLDRGQSAHQSPLRWCRMAKGSNKLERPKPQAATRMGTQGTVLEGVDMRTNGGRRFKELCADMVSHLAGDPTVPEFHLIRRAAALSVWCEAAEAEQAKGGELDVASYTTATNTFRRLLSDLGLERRMRDATPRLSDYIEGTA